MSDLRNDPAEIARELGLIMVVPGNEQELLLDLDDEASMRHMDAMIAVLRSNSIDVKVTSRTVSKSGVGRHVILQVPFELNDMTRILWQACLGSDRKRELLSVLRILQQTGRPATVLFEKPTMMQKIRMGLRRAIELE